MFWKVLVLGMVCWGAWNAVGEKEFGVGLVVVDIDIGIGTLGGGEGNPVVVGCVKFENGAGVGLGVMY